MTAIVERASAGNLPDLIVNGNHQPDLLATSLPEAHVQPTSLQTNAPEQEGWKPPPSAWTPRCHSRAEEISKLVDGYFLANWPFPNQKSRSRFLKAGFSRVTCLYFPMAKDERIESACRLLTVLFLIDGEADAPTSGFPDTLFG